MKMLTRTALVFIFSIMVLGEINAQPLPPTNLTAVQGNWGNYVYVKLNWEVAGPVMKHEHFNIYRKDGYVSDSGDFKKIYSHIPMNFWIDKYVSRGASYYYYVTAVKENYESSPSDTAEISVDSNSTAAYAYGSLKNSMTGETIPHGSISFIPVFGWDLNRVWTDSSGNYSAHLFPGTYIILANAEGYIPEFYDNARNIFNAAKITLHSNDSVNFDINLEPRMQHQKFMLSGSVKDSLGNPVKSMVELYNVTSNSFHRKFYHAVTDSLGNYNVKVREGDTLVVFAHPFNKDFFPQFYNLKESFLTADRIGISADTGNINFILVHKPVYDNGISGTVLNSDSMGVQSLILAIKLGVKEDNHRRYTAYSDSLGNYSFTNLYPGTYIMLSIPQDDYLPTYFRYDGTQTMRWKDADSVAVSSSGIISGINFIVSAVPDSGEDFIDGQVTDDSGNPVAGALVFAKDNNQQLYSFGITDQRGGYIIKGLIPGSYTVSSSSYGYDDGNMTSVSLDYNANYSSSLSFSMTPESITKLNQNPGLIGSFELSQNYPNPFNPSTVINFKVPFKSRVTIKVFNILGSEVATILNEEKPAGSYNVTFNAGSLASGVYFYQLRAGNFIATKKLMILK
jgi:hypothetical protein